MKYCTHCGKEVEDDAVVCPHCGCSTEEPAEPETEEKHGSSALCLVAKIFMVIGCIISAPALLPLAWTVPMTIHYWHCVRDHKPAGTLFKVCSLLFVSLLGGIFMLVGDETK